MPDASGSDPGRPHRPHNVFGEPLVECCAKPLTGFYRTGSCETGPEDFGVHTVCARVVRGVDDEHLLVVAEQPHVVVDVERLAVEREGAAGDGVVDPERHQKITTERSTLPSCILSNAASTPSIPISSVTNASRSSRPCW